MKTTRLKHLYLSNEWEYIVLLLYIKSLNYARKFYISVSYCTGLRDFGQKLSLAIVVGRIENLSSLSNC